MFPREFRLHHIPRTENAISLALFSLPSENIAWVAEWN